MPRNSEPPKPLQLCAAFATVWQKHWRYRGRTYITLGQDQREAKELCKLNTELTPAGVARNARMYLEDEYWAKLNHPAYGLFRQFNLFHPKPARESVSSGPMISCSSCQSVHHANEPCKVRA